MTIGPWLYILWSVDNLFPLLPGRSGCVVELTCWVQVEERLIVNVPAGEIRQLHRPLVSKESAMLGLKK